MVIQSYIISRNTLSKKSHEAVKAHHIELANLNAHAEDSCTRLHDKDPKELDRRLQHKIAIANNWYEQKGMIINQDKHQTIVLGNTDYEFSFPLRNSIDLLGVSIDNNLSFNYHIKSI